MNQEIMRIGNREITRNQLESILRKIIDEVCYPEVRSVPEVKSVTDRFWITFGGHIEQTKCDDDVKACDDYNPCGCESAEDGHCMFCLLPEDQHSTGMARHI